MVVAHNFEVWVLHGILWADTLSMVVFKHLSQQVQCFVTYKAMVLWSDKLLPSLTGMLSKNIIVVLVQSQIVLLEIGQ